MEVAFATDRLERNYRESSRAIREWGPNVGRRYITRINQLYALRDFQSVYSVRSMRLHPLKGAKRGEMAIDLGGRWRLIVEKGDSEEHVIIREVSNHYDD